MSTEQSNDFICSTYGNCKIGIMLSSGYINGTQLCLDHNKSFTQWLENNQDLIKECKKQISPSSEISEPFLLINHTIKERSGTYVHPLLLPHIISWISPDFSISVSKIVDNYFEERKIEEMEKKLQYSQLEKEKFNHYYQKNEEDFRVLEIQKHHFKDALKNTEDAICKLQMEIQKTQEKVKNVKDKMTTKKFVTNFK